MLEQLLESISAQLSAPKADLEKNLRAWLSDTIERMDLVSRDTLLRQEQQLNEARQAIKALEQQVATLEALLNPHNNEDDHR